MNCEPTPKSLELQASSSKLRADQVAALKRPEDSRNSCTRIGTQLETLNLKLETLYFSKWTETVKYYYNFVTI